MSSSVTHRSVSKQLAAKSQDKKRKSNLLDELDKPASSTKQETHQTKTARLYQLVTKKADDSKHPTRVELEVGESYEDTYSDPYSPILMVYGY